MEGDSLSETFPPPEPAPKTIHIVAQVRQRREFLTDITSLLTAHAPLAPSRPTRVNSTSSIYFS